MKAELISDEYRQSPLVQGGLEIPCKIIVKMVATLKNMELLKKFGELLDTMYSEPDCPVILGSILADDVEFGNRDETEPKQKRPKKKEKKLQETSCDIRKFFSKRKDSIKKNYNFLLNF